MEDPGSIAGYLVGYDTLRGYAQALIAADDGLEESVLRRGSGRVLT